MPFIHSEVSEVLQEFMRSPMDYQRLAVELFDVIHACETALRILELRNGVDIKLAELLTRDKNERRGYYEKGRG